MKTKLLTLGALAIAMSASSQILTHVDDTGLFYVGEGALVYSGGGVQTKGDGKLEIHGNVMIDGASTDLLKTAQAGSGATAPKLDGGNIVLKLNTPADAENSTYGQLWINGLSQANITGVVTKEYRDRKHGTYQQVGLPFIEKTLSTLSTELGKTFSKVRWSQNEILVWNDVMVRSDHYTSLATKTATGPTDALSAEYYMLGSKNLDANAPVSGDVFDVHGRPYANGVSKVMANAGAGINFGTGGNAVNSYNEKYKTYLQDAFSASSDVWTGDFGRNIYQFGNPYFTNLDLSNIGIAEAATTGDGIEITDIKGIRVDPGSVVSTSQGGTTSSSASPAKYVAFSSGVPTGDVNDLIIKPMGTFVIKMANATPKTLNFDNLRRFKSTPRATTVDYSVTAAKTASTGGKVAVNGGFLQQGNNGNGNGNSSSPSLNFLTVKQLGVKGLDINGNEIARAYYVVSPSAVSGHASDNRQITNAGSNLMGTFEEEASNGWYDTNYTSSYWLYINEANEYDFQGKAVPLALYSADIKFLKFEIREDAKLIEDGKHELSTGIGFFYENSKGQLAQISQGMVVPTKGSEYGLYYGNKIGKKVDKGVEIPSRTMVAYNPSIDHYVVTFDPEWKTASIQVYDMSGKAVLNVKEVSTSEHFVIELQRDLKATYVVTITSETGETVKTKVLR